MPQHSTGIQNPPNHDQSPKSKRPHAPGESVATDGLSITDKGGIVGKQGPSGKNKGQSGSAGPVFHDMGTTVPVGSASSPQGGGPGSVDITAKGSDQMSKGGKRSAAMS